MCQATVYLSHPEGDEEVMRDVVLLEPVEGGVRLHAFFEEPVIVKGCVGRIDFLKHTVTLLPAEKWKSGQTD